MYSNPTLARSDILENEDPRLEPNLRGGGASRKTPFWSTTNDFSVTIFVEKSLSGLKW